jgi:hypothetical protein
MFAACNWALALLYGLPEGEASDKGRPPSWQGQDLGPPLRESLLGTSEVFSQFSGLLSPLESRASDQSLLSYTVFLYGIALVQLFV